MVSGIGVFCSDKGTFLHRTLGRIYVPSMLIVCLAVFDIYDLTGGFNLNHFLSALTLILVIAAFVLVRFKIPERRWVKYHSLMLLWSYVTLLAFGSSQIAFHMPSIGAEIAVLYLPLVVVFVGWLLIRRWSRISQP